MFCSILLCIGVTTVTNISTPRGAIRAQTPPTVSTMTNLSTGFVRGNIPPRTPSPAGTVLPTGTAWMTNTQPVQLIRTSIGHSPRTRIISQNMPSVAATVSSTNSGMTTISANIVSSQGQSQQQQNANSMQAVSGSNSSGQTFVATLALPPRPQTATVVYSHINSPQQFGTATGQRLAVANSISGPRPVRPIQLGNARLPTAGLGVRVSTANISIRGPNIPVLAPPSVLTSLPGGGSTTVSTSNLTAVSGLPRIIQVQQQPSGGTTTQVLSTGRIGNLMTLHPLVMNSTNATNSNVRGTATTAKVQPSLTITHVGKSVNTSQTGGGVQIAAANLAQGATITATMPTSSANIVQQNQHSAASTPIGIVMGTNTSQAGGQSHQIAQIVNLNQSGVNVGQGHQIVSYHSRQIKPGIDKFSVHNSQSNL